MGVIYVYQMDFCTQVCLVIVLGKSVTLRLQIGKKSRINAE